MIRLQDIHLRPKLTALLFLTGLIPLMTLWWMERHQADRTLTQQATSRVETARNVGISSIKRYFSERRADMETLTQLAAERHLQAVQHLETLRDLKKARIEAYLEQRVTEVDQLAANADFMKRVAAIDWIFRQGGRKIDNKHWRETVEGFSPLYDGQKNASGQEELYFVSAQGDVVYSMAHRSELGQNVLQKPLSDTGLAKAYRAGLEGVALLDFQPYAPANNASNAFFAAPVKKEGTTIGVVITRVSRQVLTQLMQAGMPPDALEEHYLAAADGLRSDPVLTTGVTPKPPLLTIALEGKTGHGSAIGLHGQPVVAAWAPVTVRGLRWVVIAERELTR
ncbi:MAG: cache domain-containing protein, partial [Magnetococcales bacterium]|nr:cache domain-containing protein [Magnetococcales bacterium]